MAENVIIEKSFQFALDSINAYKILLSKNEYILSKQFLRSSTSIGANVNESQEAVSSADFINKLSIALKEARETVYWLKLLAESNYLEKEVCMKLISDCEEIMKIIRSIILTIKQKSAKRPSQ
jgi:four helix bundle protein